MAKFDDQRKELKWVDTEDATKSHGMLFAALLLGTFPTIYRFPLSQVPYFLALASLSIYIGSHRSLNATRLEQVTFKQVRRLLIWQTDLKRCVSAESVRSCYLFVFSLRILSLDKVLS